MRKDERAALATLLDSVGLGYTKHQAETKLLRAYLQRTQPKVTYKVKSEPVVITLSLGTCAQAPAPAKEPKAGRSPVWTAGAPSPSYKTGRSAELSTDEAQGIIAKYYELLQSKGITPAAWTRGEDPAMDKRERSSNCRAGARLSGR